MSAMSAFLLAAVAVSAVAAIWDWRTGRIPNLLTLGAFAGALVGHGAHGLQLAGVRGLAVHVGFAVSGAALCLVVPAWMAYKLEAMGGGDVKLFAAIGALCLPWVGLAAEVYAFALATVVVPIQLAFSGQLRTTLTQSWVLLRNGFRRDAQKVPLSPAGLTTIRFGPAILAGVVLAAWDATRLAP